MLYHLRIFSEHWSLDVLLSAFAGVLFLFGGHFTLALPWVLLALSLKNRNRLEAKIVHLESRTIEAINARN